MLEKKPKNSLNKSFQIKNRSLDILTHERKQHPQVRQVRGSATENKLKRCSVSLDANMVRDYKLALEHLDSSRKPYLRSPAKSASDSSISSNSSSISSLFENDITIRDVLYEDFLNSCEQEDIIINSDKRIPGPGRESMSIISIKKEDSKIKESEGIYEPSIYETFNDDTRIHARTELIFY